MGQEAESGSKIQDLLNCDIFQGHLTVHRLCTSQNIMSLFISETEYSALGIGQLTAI